MSFFGIQVGLLQVALQDADPFVSHQLCQSEDIHAVSEHGKRKSTPEIVQCGFFHTGFLRSAGKNTPQPVINQTLRTEARLVHVAVVTVGFSMIAQFEIVFESLQVGESFCLGNYIGVLDFYYSYSCNHPGHQPTCRIGRNHFLIISSAFGLLSARAGISLPQV